MLQRIYSSVCLLVCIMVQKPHGQYAQKPNFFLWEWRGGGIEMQNAYSKSLYLKSVGSTY